MRRAVLTDIELPDYGDPVSEPALGPAIFENRIAQLRERMRLHGLSATVIYGDREHVANIAWATGHDPRFEEALLLVLPDRKPVLFAGNEGHPYAEAAPGLFERRLWQALSLMGQPREKLRPLADILREAGLSPGMRIGLAGWKGFETEDGAFDPLWFETPHYLVETLRQFGEVSNAALLFMNPQDGLRVINEADQLACFEYASTKSSSALRRLILNVRPGMTEFEACRAMALDGSMLSVHINMSSGPRARYGLCSPSSRVIAKGDPIVAGHGLMGALNCRAGFMAESAADLPPGISDYVQLLRLGMRRSASASPAARSTMRSCRASAIRSSASGSIPAT
jgi:Xaa-Pro aminopeptidase